MHHRRPGLMGAIRIDLRRLHATWMELVFPRQLNPGRVLGKWTPETPVQRVTYGLWSLLGLPLVIVGYPLLLLGFAVRFNARRLDSAGTQLGVLGAVLVSVLAWGGLTAFARLHFSFDGFVAVFAASLVATLATVGAVSFSRVGGRYTTVFLAYPAAMTALFLPPVVAALYSPAVADVVLPRSDSLAIWLLDSVLAVGDLNALLRAWFDLEGLAYVLMWFAIAVPMGWLLGVVVGLADVVRPSNG